MNADAIFAAFGRLSEATQRGRFDPAKASLMAAGDHFADANRFIREAARATERGDAEEVRRFCELARKSAEMGISELS